MRQNPFIPDDFPDISFSWKQSVKNLTGGDLQAISCSWKQSVKNLTGGNLQAISKKLIDRIAKLLYEDFLNNKKNS